MAAVGLGLHVVLEGLLRGLLSLVRRDFLALGLLARPGFLHLVLLLQCQVRGCRGSTRYALLPLRQCVCSCAHIARHGDGVPLRLGGTE